MPAALADNAAAVAEGYARTQWDRGSGAADRYWTRYDKTITGDGYSGGRLREVTASDPSSQANADTRALAALNSVRGYVFGTDATNVNKGPNGGALAVGRH